ncbi:Transcriptional regulatory protein WalR [Fundidesulfovibrio magnetotacticus]|uniref:Transcriptional regulatory protein WalR n=1 Tax=Fundidesulfovibrio magnetotacticus TaxID=2730080 RepID=A0A6V8LWA4_9BACT|nr:SpoIIE family protein phosphatase [Fundidesulfovibrio magnetotacticus]GFK95180.1 Transcriptional regulatory protein WalR [Fundidesulfovibrio magnetotacticus]
MTNLPQNPEHPADAPLILVVDDEAVNRKVLTWALSEAGFRTLPASSGHEARELALAHRPDLVILDILMPGESGFDVCESLQGHPATRDIPVIFLSGLTDTLDKIKGLELGAVDYVTKPFSGAEVVARARIHLRLRQARQALIAQQAARLSTLRQAQQAMLVNPRELPEASFAVRFLTHDAAGGDIYDVFRHSGSIHGYFLADVTGHDLGASLITPALKSLIRQNAGPLYGPAETFATMNGVLRQVLSEGQVVTASYLALNRASGKATLVRAGHPAPVLVRKGGAAEFLEPEGDVLGGFESAHFETLDLRLGRGDRFLLYSDGLVERHGRTHDQARDLLARACEHAAGLPLEDAADHVLSELLPDGEPTHDDVVLLVAEV